MRAHVHFTTEQLVALPPAAVFDFMIVHQPDNHPRWETSVLKVTHDGALAVGMRGTITRRGPLGSPMTSTLEFVELQPGSRVRYIVRSGVGAVDVAIDFEPAGTGTLIRYTVAVTLRGLWRALAPIAPGIFRRLAADINEHLAELLGAQAMSARTL